MNDYTLRPVSSELDWGIIQERYNFNTYEVEKYIGTPAGWQNLYGRNLRQSSITHTGRYFWCLDAHVEDIDPLDIAWGLSTEPRFNGHTPYPYSVAWHTYALSHVVPKHLAKWALLHDAPEAFMKDIPRPLKLTMPEYKERENRLMKVIAKRFGLDPLDEPEELKPYDTQMGQTELCMLFPSGKSKLRAVGYTEAQIAEFTSWKSWVRNVNRDTLPELWMTRFKELGLS